MADLLECLIQIKGVADTPRRLALRVAAAADRSSSSDAVEHRARDIAARLLAAERRFHECLTLMLTRDCPALPDLGGILPADDGRDTLDASQRDFAARRAETVGVLDTCSADQLNAVGIEPSRGAMTVADLVAVMLAHDTDCLGELVIR